MASSNRSTDFLLFLPAVYPVAGLLVLAPIADLVGLAWPIRASQAGWRFGSLGIGMSNALIQLLGLATAMTTAAFLRHRRFLRAMALLSLIIAAVTVFGMIRFLIDYRTVRELIASAERAALDASAFRAMILASLVVPVLITLGGRGWTASEPASMAEPDRPETPARVIPIHRDQNGSKFKKI